MDEDDVRWVRNRACGEIYDANHGTAVRVATPDAVDATLRRADELYADLGTAPSRPTPSPRPPSRPASCSTATRRRRRSSSSSPATSGPTRRPVAIRPVEGPADWASLARLTRRDHEEQAEKDGRVALGPARHHRHGRHQAGEGPVPPVLPGRRRRRGLRLLLLLARPRRRRRGQGGRPLHGPRAPPPGHRHRPHRPRRGRRPGPGRRSGPHRRRPHGHPEGDVRRHGLRPRVRHPELHEAPGWCYHPAD